MTQLRENIASAWAKRALAAGVLVAALMTGLATTAPTHASTTFTVNLMSDENDLDFSNGTFDGPSDGVCDVSPGVAGS